MTPRILHRRDAAGRAFVRVELANRPDVFVAIDRDDFDRLEPAGKPRWLLNESGPGRAFVRRTQLDVRGQLAVVARQVAEAGIGQQVGYHDGNRLNLRRENLRVAPGRAKGQTPLHDEFTASRPGIRQLVEVH